MHNGGRWEAEMDYVKKFLNVNKLLVSLLSALIMFTSPDNTFAKGGHSSKVYSHRSHSYGPRHYRLHTYRSHSSRASGVKRDSRGHIARSFAAKKKFERETGYPHGRPGYIVDHVVPLKRGGSDTPDNMQWQTKEEAKQKDKWE
jgi:hypothetical protein